MKLNILLLLNCIIITPALAETVYQTIDQHGNAVFSDQATAKAKIIELKLLQTVNNPLSILPQSDPSSSTKDQSHKLRYQTLAITNPINDLTIHSNEGQVAINIQIEPALNETDTIVLLLDGQQIKSTRQTTLFLTDIDRGAHTIAIAVQDAQNEIIQRSDEQTFYLRKVSILSPNSKASSKPLE